MNFMNTFKKQRTGIRCMLLMSLILLLLSGRSFAGSCTGTAQATSLSLPSSIAVPRDAPIGSLLTGWTNSPATENYWYCTSVHGGSSFYSGVRSLAGPLFLSDSGQQYNGTGAPGGLAYTVYETNVPGVGIAIAVDEFVSAHAWAGWIDPSATNWSGRTYNGAKHSDMKYGSKVAVALIKTGTVSTGGTVNGGTVVKSIPVTDSINHTDLAVSFTINPVTVIPLTCTTPDVDVAMGSFKTTDFPTVGSLSPGTAASVPIQLLNCPSGTPVDGTKSGVIHTIEYRIDPTSGTAATNVAALTPGESSATGVGIQLFDSSGKVFPLSKEQTLSGYNSTAGGDYTIPLTARYYATGQVTAGPANSTMTLTMLYE
jgi:major type 1 subunit fimbrin (pilin)